MALTLGILVLFAVGAFLLGTDRGGTVDSKAAVSSPSKAQKKFLGTGDF